MPRLTRQESRARTRERLLESARQEFAQSGYGGASIDAIAENAGYSRGAFYANFAGKEDLLLEILRQFLTRELERTQEFLRAGHTPEELHASAERQIDEACADPTWPLLGLELQLRAARDPAIAKAYEDSQREHHDQLGQLFEELFRLAGKRMPTDRRLLASLMTTIGQAIVPIALRRQSSGGPVDAGALYTLVMKGLIAGADPL
jgi:AcrR family transcriptional regulator